MMIRKAPPVALLFLIVALLIGTTFPKAISQNLRRLKVAHTWMSLKPIGVTFSDALQDGIPDGWNIEAWGGARAIYRLEEQGALAGERAVSIERTNTLGGAALTQHIAVEPDSHLICTVYAKGVAEGAAGAIQVQFRGEGTGGWIKEGGWLGITPGEDWQQYRLAVAVPPGVNEARLLLRAVRGLVWFDEVYIGVDNDGHLGPNLLKNPGFEQDGIREDPLAWWQDHIDSGLLIGPEAGMLERLIYLNITDILAGRYEAIKQRARQLGDRCGATPEMTGWLLAREDDFEQAGGAVARERLYQLAIELAPNCPQPYAALAGLYESHHGAWRAAELYHQAAELSGETALAGGYYFAEGFLHVSNTGDMERAIPALQWAEQLSGWEGESWYWGAASLYLGAALEAEGRLAEARATYQRVVDCALCSYHHAAALKRLDALSADEKDR